MNSKYEVHEHDVLIIGAGGAGLRAAIEALAQGVRVGVVCKSLLGKAHTVMAEGGIAAAMPPSAITVCALPSRDLHTTPTRTPWARASIAARRPAPPAPMMSTSCSWVSYAGVTGAEYP